MEGVLRVREDEWRLPRLELLRTGASSLERGGRVRGERKSPGESPIEVWERLGRARIVAACVRGMPVSRG